MLSHTLTDADCDRITEHVESSAHFEAGDRVTVKPTDHGIGYWGSELEGVPLIVKSAVWRDVSRADAYVKSEHPDEVVTLADGTEVYVGQVEYTFEEGRDMPESSLITWDAYRAEHDRIRLLEGGENTDVWLEPRETPCEVCGCNMLRQSYWDNGVVSAGRESCPACDDVVSEHHP